MPIKPLCPEADLVMTRRLGQVLLDCYHRDVPMDLLAKSSAKQHPCCQSVPGPSKEMQTSTSCHAATCLPVTSYNGTFCLSPAADFPV